MENIGFLLAAFTVSLMGLIVLFSPKKQSKKELHKSQEPVVSIAINSEDSVVKTATKNGYIYHKRHCLMTPTEKELFLRLMKLYGNRYLVLPQVHLSSLLDHTVRGQNWKAAHSSINQKSVDFVFCSYPDVEPILALEYDDWRHEYHEGVKEKDGFKDELFAQAELPLTRIRVSEHLSDERIQEKLAPFLG